MASQDNWRWCKRCDGLFYGGNPPQVCPSGGAHDASGSPNYTLFYGEGRGQQEWRWCGLCGGLFYGPGQGASACPAGGTHQGVAGGASYGILSAVANDQRQRNWRWCNKCQGM